MKTVKVSELKNMHKVIAEAYLKNNPDKQIYTCRIDNNPVNVVRA